MGAVAVLTAVDGDAADAVGEEASAFRGTGKAAGILAGCRNAAFQHEVSDGDPLSIAERGNIVGRSAEGHRDGMALPVECSRKRTAFGTCHAADADVGTKLHRLAREIALGTIGQHIAELVPAVGRVNGVSAAALDKGERHLGVFCRHGERVPVDDSAVQRVNSHIVRR